MWRSQCFAKRKSKYGRGAVLIVEKRGGIVDLRSEVRHRGRRGRESRGN